MALITLTGIDQSNFLDGSSGIQASDITTRQAGITTSQSFDEWRKFTNALGQDVGILARELALLNAAGTPASNSDLSGTTTINNLSLGGHTVNDIRLDNELRAFASALDTALVTEKLLSGTKVDIDAAIALKANITSPAFLNSAQLTHSSDTILKVKTTNTSSDAEFVLAGGTSSGFARIKFQDTASPNAYIYVNKSGAMTVKAASLNLNAAGVISGVGSGLTSLNASNLSSGTISDSRIPSTITRDTELTAFTGTANISTVGTIGTGTWQGSVINQTYIGSLPTSKITSGTFANARISQGSVTQHQAAITSVGTLTGLTINSGNNVIAEKAPTSASHLTNKTYVDTQVATKDNYQGWNFKVNTGSTNTIIKNELITLAVQDSDTAALEFVATSTSDVSLSINLANLSATKDGIIPNAVLPDLVIGDFSNATIQTAAEANASFGDNDTSLLTAAAINDLIVLKLGAQLNDTITGAFVSHLDPGTGIDVGTVESDGGIDISLDQSEFSTMVGLAATDYVVIGDADIATPKRIKLQDIDLNFFDHVNKLTLAELSNVDDAAATSGEFLKWTGSKWIGDSIANKISISNLTNVSGADTGNTTGDLLRWNGTSWTDSTPTEVADYASPQIDLADLKNVTASSPSAGQFLKWSGTAWVSGVDNNTTYNSHKGIIESSNTFGLKNADGLSNNGIMKWDDTNGQLVDSSASEDGTYFNIGDRALYIDQDNTDSGDRIIITAYKGASGSGLLPVTKGADFSSANTRKAGISFGSAGGANASNDPGLIVHESGDGTTAADNNKSVLHLCPGDDNADSDYVSIHGYNDAESTGLKLTTSGDVSQVNNLEFREGASSSEASGFTNHPSTSGLVNGNLYLQRTNGSNTQSSRRGGRLWLAKPHNTDWADASLRGANHSWSIFPDPIDTPAGASLQVYEYDGGTGASRLTIRSQEYGANTAGIARLPTANKTYIGNSGTGTEKDIVTYEKMQDYVAEAIAPISKPDILRFCPQGFIYTRSESKGTYDSDSFYYWRNDNGYITVHLNNLQDWAIKGDSSKVSGQNTTFDGYYVIDFSLYREAGTAGDDYASNKTNASNFNARTATYHGTARIATTSDNPSSNYNLFTNLNVNLYGTDDAGGGPQFGDWELEVRDVMTGKSMRFRIDFKSWSRNTSGTKTTAERTLTYTMQDLDTFRGGSSTHITNSSASITD